MKKLFKINILATLALGLMFTGVLYVRAQGGGPVGECPAENDVYVVYLPDATCCNLFYKCNWGVPELQKCPEGLHFNPFLCVCDFPTDAKCMDEGTGGGDCGDGDGNDNSSRYPVSSKCNVAQSDNGKNPCKVIVISCQGRGYGCTPQKCPAHDHDE